MKKLLFLLTLSGLCIQSLKAQRYGSKPAEKFGNTLNIGGGIGYHAYVSYPAPVFMLNYELDLVRNVTLAPFIGVSSYRDSYYWGSPEYPYQDYHYRQTVIPMGIKGSYYFDELLKLNPKWDVYAAASIGIQPIVTTWDNGYYGDKTISNEPPLLYANGHLGARYHVSRKVGVFVDLSTGFLTTGGSFKF